MSIEFIQVVASLLGAVLTFWPHRVQNLMLRITPEPTRWWYRGRKAVIGLVVFGVFLLVEFFVLPLGRLWLPLGKFWLP